VNISAPAHDGDFATSAQDTINGTTPERETTTIAPLANNISDTEDLENIASEVEKPNITVSKWRGQDNTAIMDSNDDAESAAVTEISSDFDRESDESYESKVKTCSARVKVKAPSKQQRKAPQKPPAKSSTKAPKRVPAKDQEKQTNADDPTHDKKRQRVSNSTENVTTCTPSSQVRSAVEKQKPSKKRQSRADEVREIFAASIETQHEEE
jgi:hypothetical protein